MWDEHPGCSPCNKSLLAAGEACDGPFVVHEVLQAALAVGVIAGQDLITIHNYKQECWETGQDSILDQI